MEFLYQQEGYELIGAAMEVSNEMGPGFLEEVYQECIEMELADRKIPFQPQLPLELWYKGKKMKKRYKPDLYAFDCIRGAQGSKGAYKRKRGSVTQLSERGAKKSGLSI